MTFEAIFAGRMTLMRAQRHIAQAHLVQVVPFPEIPRFTSPAGEQAFWIVERLLCALESEFDGKKQRLDKRRQRNLDRRANRQVARAK